MNADSELRDLYQEVILDHYRHPRNYRALPEGCRCAQGYNPLCGDDVTVFLRHNKGLIEDVSFQGTGCAICTASASLMTEALKGLRHEAAEGLAHRFCAMLTEEGAPEVSGKLAILAGVRHFPLRVKCATLAWRALEAILRDDGSQVSTE